MRTAVYIDGFNLYYWVKPTPYRWIDLKLLCANALRAPRFSHEIVAVKYFTARVSDNQNDPGAANRQDVYLQALIASTPEFQPYFGEFRRKPKRMPRVNPGGGTGPTVEVWATEEKGSDVNLAVELVNDAWLDRYDLAVVVSNDSDLCSALSVVKQRRKRVGVLVRGDARVVSLRKVSNFQKTLTEPELQGALLPREIPGTNIRIPDAWARRETGARIR